MKKWIVRLGIVFGILSIFFFFCLAYAYFIEPSRLVVNKTELKVAKVDPAFEGLKIVMISDVHGGSNNVTIDKMRQVVETSNEQNADLIVLLGDYVSQKSARRSLGAESLRMPMNVVADGVAGLQAKYGVYVVLGNHDVWYDDNAVAAEFRRVGYRVLDGECTPLNINGHTLRLLGLKDHTKIKNWKSFSDDAKTLIKGCGDRGDIFVLEHSPDILPIITGDLLISPDMRLILAAHTHGGQVWLPILGTPVVPSSYGQKYSYGHIRENGVDMFVTTGIGTSVLPIRFMVPPEIAVLTLRAE